jgi:hypothetical protein
MAKAIAELRKAVVEEAAIRDRLYQGGVSTSGVFELLPFVGCINGNAPTALIDSWLSLAREKYSV